MAAWSVVVTVLRLEREWCKLKCQKAMRIFRAVFTALIVTSVAILPGPGAVAHPHSALVPSLHSAECCDAEKPCETQMRECVSSAGCTVQCFNGFGVVPTGIAVAPSSVGAKAQVAGDQSFDGPATSPPLPPPRV